VPYAGEPHGEGFHKLPPVCPGVFGVLVFFFRPTLAPFPLCHQSRPRVHSPNSTSPGSVQTVVSTKNHVHRESNLVAAFRIKIDPWELPRVPWTQSGEDRKVWRRVFQRPGPFNAFRLDCESLATAFQYQPARGVELHGADWGARRFSHPTTEYQSAAWI